MRKKQEWSRTASPADNARRVLPRLAERFFRAGRRAVSAGRDKELHEFRLDAKHFRYTLEFFQPLYGPSLAARLATLRRVQTFLGAISDAQATHVLAAAAGVKTTAESRRLLRWLTGHRRRQIEEFRKFWRESVDPAGAEARWKNYLRRFAHD